MKARIEELKKMSQDELYILIDRHQAIFGIDVCDKMGDDLPLEVVSARMWEKAVKELPPDCTLSDLEVAMDILHQGKPYSTSFYFNFYATPTEKLICAIAALEAKGESNGKD